jgi:predicted dehydrogenase
MTHASPIRILVMGAGEFARETHVPALAALRDRYQVVGIFSRTRAKAEALAATLPYPVPAYDDEAAAYAADADVIDLVLPIDALPDAIRRALQAGRHVISEKPIAPDSATARELMAYAARFSQQHWSVAENWRFEPAFQAAAERLRADAIGRVLNFHWAFHVGIVPGFRYYETEWRRSGTFQGGFILDAGVHHVAALRMLFGPVAEVAALSALMRDDVPPIDTLGAALRFESGLLGTYTASYAAALPFPSPLVIKGERGAMQIDRGSLTVHTADGVEQVPLPNTRSVQAELAAFADQVQHGTPDPNTPQAALEDLLIVEAMLRASETGQRTAVERL